ncbi:MAG: helix-turn-helix domain-containing protein [Deltaproteobacteria bacterium]|nr:helix-turn-helix domain-containing protein [Deltaproteobacteria bacterium]
MSKGTYLVEEVSEYLRIHPYTVRRLCREGKIPAFKVGGQWRFDIKEIEEWRKNQGSTKSTKKQEFSKSSSNI